MLLNRESPIVDFVSKGACLELHDAVGDRDLAGAVGVPRQGLGRALPGAGRVVQHRQRLRVRRLRRVLMHPAQQHLLGTAESDCITFKN